MNRERIDFKDEHQRRVLPRKHAHYTPAQYRITNNQTSITNEYPITNDRIPKRETIPESPCFGY
jgi:hypothetical protein